MADKPEGIVRMDGGSDDYQLHPFGAPLTYIVVFIDGGRSTLASRRVFSTEDDADHYAEGLSHRDGVIVVEGRWHQLFIPPALRNIQ